MKKVEIYSTPTCHFCHAAKEFFGENKIEFTDHDVATDMEKRKEMVDMTGQMGVPVIVVSDEAEEGKEAKKEVIIGFDQAKLSDLLGVA
jgi:glutaredoxin 3